jgi:hypothetical protein
VELVHLAELSSSKEMPTQSKKSVIPAKAGIQVVRQIPGFRLSPE